MEDAVRSLWDATVSTTHTAYAALAAVAVMVVVGCYLGRTAFRSLIAFGAGYVFLLALYALGVKAAGNAMLSTAAIIVLFLILSLLAHT
jgi:hypothetical protein